VFCPTRVKGISPNLHSHWRGLAKILGQITEVVYRVRMPGQGCVVVLHQDRLAPYQPHAPLAAGDEVEPYTLHSGWHTTPTETVPIGRSGSASHQDTWQTMLWVMGPLGVTDPSGQLCGNHGDMPPGGQRIMGAHVVCVILGYLVLDVVSMCCGSWVVHVGGDLDYGDRLTKLVDKTMTQTDRATHGYGGKPIRCRGCMKRVANQWSRAVYGAQDNLKIPASCCFHSLPLWHSPHWCQKWDMERMDRELCKIEGTIQEMEQLTDCPAPPEAAGWSQLVGHPAQTDGASAPRVVKRKVRALDGSLMETIRWPG